MLLITFSNLATAQKLRFLIPDGAVVQYAGSIGYLSGGVNYSLFKNNKGSFQLIYGYTPKSKGGNLSTINTKFAYRPWEIKLYKWLTIYPINPGAFFSYTVDKNFDLTWDRDQYPQWYYYWSEALHFHISVGSEIKFNTDGIKASKKVKALTLYYEVNTNDMYLVNYFQSSKALTLKDILKAGIGVKASF